MLSNPNYFLANPNGIQRKLVAVGIATLALAGCSGHETPVTPKTTAWSHYPYGGGMNIECTQIVLNDVLLDCKASEPGKYQLYIGDYSDASNNALDAVLVQREHDDFNLIPSGEYRANCTKGYVTLTPMPKPGPSQVYEVYSFDICAPR